MKNSILIFFCLVQGLYAINIFAQNKNDFLDRDFWKSKPSIDTIKEKIKEGDDPTEFNSNSFDPICYAIFQDNPLETIEFLLGQGNEINKITHDARTYLFWAAYKSNLELVKYLIKNGAKTDVIDQHGYTALIFAAVTGQTDEKLYNYLNKHGFNIKTEKDREGRNVLLAHASSMKNTDLLDFLIKKGLDINSKDKNGNGIFHHAAKTGNIEILKALVDKYKVDYRKNTTTNENAILFASQSRNNPGISFYKYLEGLGLNPSLVSKEGKNALHNLAYRNKNVEIINYFLDKKVDANQKDDKGNTPLINASSSNSIEIIQLLLSKTKDINSKNKDGISALTQAVKYNSLEVVKLFIKEGADISVLDKKKNNLAFHLVNSYRRKLPEFKEKMDFLVQKGLDPKATQKGNKTLIHLAVDKEDIGLIKYLIGLEIDVNAKDKNGQTVLHQAAMNAKSDKILKYLLEAGADKNIKTEFDETVHDLAKENELLNKNNVDIEFLK